MKYHMVLRHHGHKLVGGSHYLCLEEADVDSKLDQCMFAEGPPWAGCAHPSVDGYSPPVAATSACVQHEKADRPHSITVWDA
jgi:hypothetical protein